ncbi:PREDICTED: transcription factor AP-4-like isoform X2 [Priapulus caudatus]|uniref:Transcription factor AP-4-like isoform X2 n=1 Tax=Priapulus caudatus TaxID=37621 RepID=A0ABM1F9P6_PRICU|nr:PREDICTED: transcription factor AP-4-like isoform X2 [Priapulus caudatus]
MSGYQNTPMKKRVVEEYKRQADDSNDMSEGYYNNMMSSPEMPKCDQTGQEPEREKRIRREIANSNERRRMQSINSGFQQLRNLIPASDGEKLSKAAILQQTSQYLYKLQKEKDQLGSANMQLKHMLSKFNNMDSDSCSGQDSPPPKRKKHDTGKVT